MITGRFVLVVFPSNTDLDALVTDEFSHLQTVDSTVAKSEGRILRVEFQSVNIIQHAVGGGTVDIGERVFEGIQAIR